MITLKAKKKKVIMQFKSFLIVLSYFILLMNYKML